MMSYRGFLLQHGPPEREELARGQVGALDHHGHGVRGAKALDFEQALAQADIHVLNEVLIGLDLAKLEDRRQRVTPHAAHLLGKAVCLHQVRGLGGAIGHKRATTMLANNEPQALELL